MIKVFGIKSEKYKEASFSEVLKYFKDKEFVQYDSETTGMLCHSSDLICFQIGDFENQFVISSENLKRFKPFLEGKILIGHNIKFDLCFLYKHGIYPNKVYDTFLAESVITCGYHTVKRSLAAVAKRRLGVDLDKSLRDEINREGLSDRIIEYAANDVKHLESIKDSQLLDIKRLDLKHAVEVENQYVLALAYIEYCGFKLDKDKWLKKMESDFIEFTNAKDRLDLYIYENYPKYADNQLDLFSENKKSSINWSSSKQVVALFKEIGIPVRSVVKGVEKESVEAKNIERFKKEYPLVDLYLKFKEYEKVVTTYGSTFLKQINPNTGRIHTNFKQVMDTGRLSSGGSDKKTKDRFINFQNIPSDKETRGCFVAEPGNTLIIADYSGQEQVVLANRSMDPSLLEFYDKGLADMHSFVASKMYPELEGLSLDDIKEKHKDKRQNAKTAGFAINYGGVGATIARNNNLTPEEGEAVYQAYFKAFPGLLDYFQKEKLRGLKAGYIQFNDIIRTKSFIESFDVYESLRNKLDKGYWERWKSVKERTPNKDTEEYIRLKSEISQFFKIKGAIERKALNYPIQGTSATITKISGIYFFSWIKEQELLNKVLFVNTVHDENVAECPKDISEKVAKALKDCMIKAGQIFCKRVPLNVDVHISEFWKK